MTALPEVSPAVHIEVLEQVARGSQLPGIADRLAVDLRIVRALAAQAGAPDLGQVRCHLRRLRTAEDAAVPGQARCSDPVVGFRSGWSAAWADRDATGG